MCKVLNISRSSCYYKKKPKECDTELENGVSIEFNLSHKIYGCRKLRVELMIKQNGHEAYIISRRRIGVIMNKYKLKSKYTLRQKRKKRDEKVNNDDVENKVARQFDNRKPLEVVVSDLTYIKCCGVWYYLCILLDLHSRKIIGYAIGRYKDAKLVRTAFYSVRVDLRKINLFHTDRGGEFKNRIIDDILSVFGIERSLSAKGTPIDNAVAESMYNIVKTEFVYGNSFRDIDDLELKWFEYVNWYNNVRIHGSLGYVSPAEYERNEMVKAVRLKNV